MSETRIVVTGDVVKETSIYEGSRPFASDSPNRGTRVRGTFGGASLLHDVLESVRPGVSSLGLGFSRHQAWPSHFEAHALYVTAAAGFKSDPPPASGEKPARVWRVSRLLGYGHTAEVPPPEPPLTWQSPEGPAPTVLLLDDGGLGFRTLRAKERWPCGGTDEQVARWVLLKTTQPLCDGYLWRHLVQQCATPAGSGPRQMVVVVSADELRLDGAPISRGLSWERTISDTCWTLVSHPRHAALMRAAHVLVLFRREGVLWVDNTKGTAASDRSGVQSAMTLILDPGMAEGQWATTLSEDRHCSVPGHMSVFTAAIALELADAPEAPDFVSAIRRGLTATRELRLLGHGPVGSDVEPGFPFEGVARILRGQPSNRKRHQPQDQFFAAPLREVGPDGRLADGWSIAAQGDDGNVQAPLYGLAFQVAIYGAARLTDVPHARFGGLLSVDTVEIETLRSLRQLIDGYEKGGQQKQPLCIGAFGPPGAGKSFGIKQIAQEVLGREVPFLEFNLSQYNGGDPADLVGAFHQVRDVVLGGRTPVVFWDEFDSKGLHWLQYFLAPMQDGKFQSGALTHTLGKCVFVFAGATSWDFEHFGPAPEPATPEECSHLKDVLEGSAEAARTHQALEAEFRQKKGPDFISRLQGHINVLGPNRRLLFNFATGRWDRPDPGDITFPVRRAILLRSFLKVKDAERLDIDPDLLNALLRQPRYRHGSRSMERTVALLRVEHAPSRPAQLPPPQVLEQHLDTAGEFRQLLAETTAFLTHGNQRRLAAAIHENYRRLTDRAYVRDPQFLESFDKLSVWGQATNVAAARGIPRVLAVAGLCVKPGLATSEENETARRLLRRHLDALRREEHARWMGYLLANGWLQAPDTDPQTGLPARDNQLLLHNCLLQFEALSEEDKKKDHDAILSLPDAVASIGFKVVPFDDLTG